MLHLVYQHKTDIIQNWPEVDSKLIAIYKDKELAEFCLETINGCIIPIMSDL